MDCNFKVQPEGDQFRVTCRRRLCRHEQLVPLLPAHRRCDAPEHFVDRLWANLGLILLGRRPGEHGLWGKYVKHFLGLLGVTDRRYQQLKVRLGLDAACGCSRRQKFLDRLGTYAYHHGWWAALKHFRQLRHRNLRPR